jgi:hypothetical protein
MRYTKASTITALLALALSCAYAGGGGGGFLIQRQMPSWNFSPLPDSDPSFQAWAFNGYGYGITNDGTIIGGFGQFSMDLSMDSSSSDALDDSDLSASSSYDSSSVYMDFFGGLILGESFGGGDDPRINLACKLGVGWVVRETDASSEGGVYICGLVDPYLELSFPLARFLRISAVLGYQYVHAFAGMGTDIDDSNSLSSDYDAGTPTIGLALTFGK